MKTLLLFLTCLCAAADAAASAVEPPVIGGLERAGAEKFTVSTANGAPQRVNGFMSASIAPGLGIKPKMDVLGKPVVVVE